MAVRTRIVTRSQTLMQDSSMSEREQSLRLAEVARSALRSVQSDYQEQLGHVPGHTTEVDGRFEAPEETVRPAGTIVYEFSSGLRGAVIKVAYDLLWLNAPVLTGRFRDSIRIYADGAEVSDAIETIEAEEIILVATTAYARKIERRKTMGGQGLFEKVTEDVKRRFGNIAYVKYTFASPRGGGTHLAAWAAGKDGARFYRSRKKRVRSLGRQGTKDRRNPAIQITFRKG